MSLMKRSDWPSTVGGALSDFFDDRFLMPHWMRESIPAVNVKENERNYEIDVAVPGYSKSDIKVSLDNGMLTISAETKEERKADEDKYRRREFNARSFSRSLSLPDNIDEQTIDARYVDGVLKLSVNKAKADDIRPKKTIEVK
jgi:HSP20 family protein